jgi:hypothetical protein
MTSPIRVLLVEDNPGDAELMRDTIVRTIEGFWLTIVKLP